MQDFDGSGPEAANDVLEQIEVQLLLEGVYRIYGYDFRQYAPNSIRRRAKHRMEAERLRTISELQSLVLRDPAAMQRLLQDFSIPVTEMFRDPDVFRALRKQVLPALKKLPNFRIWHAGCSTGEEVYSMAIMLREEGLEGRGTIYATDMNDASLEQARAGLFPLNRMKLYTSNYLKAEGRLPFSEYYSVADEKARFDPTLRKHVVFARHNLATDHSFNEFHLILCRNVLIYFNPELQARVLRLFRESMAPGGTLALGTREAVLQRTDWEEIDPVHRLYKAV